MNAKTRIELPEVTLDFMNDDHALAATQLTAMIEALGETPVDLSRFAKDFREFLEHSRAHFLREEEIMQQASFPPYPVHKGEHDRVIAMMEQIAVAIDAGQLDDDIRAAVSQDIPAWLLQHVQTMDMVTARWITSKQG